MNRNEYYKLLSEKMKGNTYWKKTKSTQFKKGHSYIGVKKEFVNIKCNNCGKIFKSEKRLNKKHCSFKCYCVFRDKNKKPTITKLSHSEAMKKIWKNPKFKKNIIIGIKKAWTKKGKVKNKRYIHDTHDKKYILWRKKVFERDNYQCQKCIIRSGKGQIVILQAHHIKKWSKFPNLRYRVKNGITLCKNCHKLIHKKHYSHFNC